MIDFDIMAGIARVEDAVKARRQAGPGAHVRGLDEVDCMATRTLFSRYVDVVLWSGEVDRDTYRAVRKALIMGRDAVAGGDPKIVDAVTKRVAEFEKFSAKHRVGAAVAA